MFANQTPCPAQWHVPGVLRRLRERGLLEHRDSRLKTVQQDCLRKQKQKVNHKLHSI